MSCPLFAGGSHCQWCRTHPEWRTQGGYPEVCPHGITEKIRWGDVVEKLVKPIARLLRPPCLDKTGKLKAGSPCAKRRDALNRI